VIFFRLFGQPQGAQASSLGALGILRRLVIYGGPSAICGAFFD
jgi:hypothetical protein